jgi:lipoprotein NlpI
MALTVYLRIFCTLLSFLTFSVCSAQENKSAETMRQGMELSKQGKHAEAVALFDSVIQTEPQAAPAYYWRGRLQLLLGKIEPSVADLNKYVSLVPEHESRQWERGLAFYYAGQFAAGAKQFEQYQTYYSQDVENSVWRFLCSAKVEGIETARKNMLPIERDPRVPLMEVYELFRGNKTIDEVLNAAKAENPPVAILHERMFYAHLYLGLYCDAHDKPQEALQHLELAAGKFAMQDYMGDIAKLHLQQLKGKAKK